MMSRSVGWASLLSMLLFAGLAVSPAWAMGQGKGRTKSQFKVDFNKQAKNRLFCKLNVAEAVDGLPENDSGTRNDDLADYELTVTVNGVDFTGTFNSKGKIKEDGLRAKLTANGGILHIDLRGEDLVTVLGLDPEADGKNLNLSIPIVVSINTPDSGSGPGEPVELFNGNYDFKYKSKAGRKANGKGFPSKN